VVSDELPKASSKESWRRHLFHRGSRSNASNGDP
jgi:hypothetical protein